MIFIDAAQIRIGGALIILDVLTDYLQEQNIEFVILCHEKNLNTSFEKAECIISKGFLYRWVEYRDILKNYPINRILCFGSFPPPFKVNQKVFTYFHNPNLLKNSDISLFSLKEKLHLNIRRAYLATCVKNSDYYIVQSPSIKKSLMESYNLQKKAFHIFPFYDLKNINKIKNRNLTIQFDFCFISIPYPHKNHKNLLEAWLLLHEEGINPSLVLTVEKDYNIAYNRVEELIKKGLNILNFERVNIETALEITAKSKFCIFPSLNESFGLGLIESQILGLKILSSNLPYVNEIVNPSLTFDPYSPEDIKNKVKEALSSKNLKDTTPIVENKLPELVDFILNE